MNATHKSAVGSTTSIVTTTMSKQLSNYNILQSDGIFFHLTKDGFKSHLLRLAGSCLAYIHAEFCPSPHLPTLATTEPTPAASMSWHRALDP